ncbi:hypothetical protein [Vibrio breoganii]|uniref:hypothetical protein n=1 Tax=Vibrio breoganii TaxID=553239 RepID=UPI001054F47D|nr:hypothetical protein [Vibrio breoganii]
MYSRIPSNFHDFGAVLIASIYLLLNYALNILGVVFYKRYLSSKFSIYSLIYPKNITLESTSIKQVGVFFLIGGFVIYFYLLSKLGGLGAVWTNIDSRTEMLAGSGYILKLYMFWVQFGSILLIRHYLVERKYFFVGIILLLSIFLLVSFGSRGNVILLCFGILLVCHYSVKRIKTIFSLRNLFIFVSLILFLLFALILRKNDAVEYYTNNPAELASDSINSFEEGFVMRVGRLERDAMVVKYFSDKDVWMGATYLALFTAPIPRTIYADKPTIDQGKYLVKMSYGHIIEPPESNSTLPNYSWPTGYIEPYMNFHLPGLIIFSLLSGILFSSIFEYFQNTGNPLYITFYSIIAFGGSPDLSVMSIVNLLTYFLLFYFTIILVRIFVPFISNKFK